MFLAKIFRHSKLLFLLMLAFIAAQLFVVYNHGMVFSPFYNYWMYASSFKRADSLPVLQLYSGGKPLRGADYNQQDWDKIILTYDYVKHIDANQKMYGEIRRLSRKGGFELGPEHYLMTAEVEGRDSLLHLWLQHASRTAGKSIDSVTDAIYRWDGNKLVQR